MERGEDRGEGTADRRGDRGEGTGRRQASSAMGLPVDRGSPYARPHHHGCWYYLRYFFLFVSLIQFLIILGLVLFMVYGNVHLGTEKALEATERRAQSLQGQVLGLSASCANLSKELNITTRAKDSIMQMMINARRDGDRINISYRQCQADLVSGNPWVPAQRGLCWGLGGSLTSQRGRMESLGRREACDSICISPMTPLFFFMGGGHCTHRT